MLRLRLCECDNGGVAGGRSSRLGSSPCSVSEHKEGVVMSVPDFDIVDVHFDCDSVESVTLEDELFESTPVPPEMGNLEAVDEVTTESSVPRVGGASTVSEPFDEVSSILRLFADKVKVISDYISYTFETKKTNTKTLGYSCRHQNPSFFSGQKNFPFLYLG